MNFFAFLCFTLTSFSILSFEMKFNVNKGIETKSYTPRIIKFKKVYISNKCKKTCMAKEKFNLNKCMGKTIRAVRKSGDFEQICYFKDDSSYLL